MNAVAPVDPAAVAVFGAAVVDRVGRSSGAFVPGSSNPGRIATGIGGVGFNMARGLSRLGLAVGLVARVGADDDGDRVVAAARALGIAVDGVSRSPDRPTGSYLALLDERGELVGGLADMAVVAEMDGAVLEAAAAAGGAAGWWLVDTNLEARALSRLAVLAGTRMLVVNTISVAKAPRAAAVLGAADLVVANRAEAAVLAGTGGSLGDLAGALVGRGARAAAVTGGGEGAVLAVAGRCLRAPALAVPVADVTGAGDAFAAGLVAALVGGAAPEAALARAVAAASIAVETMGADVPLTSAEVARRAAGVTVEG